MSGDEIGTFHCSVSEAGRETDFGL
jgi:hypothetical protein